MRRYLWLVFFCFLLTPDVVRGQSLPPGYWESPYGIAAYPEGLKYLSMPSTVAYYTWTPLEKTQYITVRPYSPPRSSSNTAPDTGNYWFWDYATKKIGKTDTDRKKFAEFVTRNTGRVWIIANEPERKSQDNLTPTEYAQMFNTYHTTIKSLDPLAKLAIASVGQVTYYVEFTQVKPYYDSVFTEYKRLYGVELPLDYWNMHAYYAGWNSTHTRVPSEMVDAAFSKLIDPYISYAKTVRGGRYKDKKILATEVGFGLPLENSLGLSEADGLEFVKLYTRRLAEGVRQGTFERFFWYHGGYKSECEYSYECFMKSDWKTPTNTALVYSEEAKKWDKLHGVGKADFTDDKKINVFDYSMLVSGFAGSNTGNSLDVDIDVDLVDMKYFLTILRYMDARKVLF